MDEEPTSKRIELGMTRENIEAKIIANRKGSESLGAVEVDIEIKAKIDWDNVSDLLDHLQTIINQIAIKEN